MQFWKKCVWFALILTLWGCQRIFDVQFIDELIYEQLIKEGWQHFAQAQYDSALYKFARAASKFPEQAEPHIGAGWTHMASGELEKASEQLHLAITLEGNTATAFAGLAFLDNAWKNFSQSNQWIDSVFHQEPSWEFQHGWHLAAIDLWLLKAENYFMLGQFQASLKALQQVEPAFQADVTTTEGQAALAAEIARLRRIRLSGTIPVIWQSSFP